MSDQNINIDAKLPETISAVAKTFPKTISTVDTLVSDTLSILGVPISYLNEYAQHSLKKTKAKLEKKLADIPTEKLTAPPAHVAGPALQASLYVTDCETLHDMFASLLATSMNKDKQQLAHPSFAEVIKQLSPDEAKIIATPSFINDLVKPMCTVRVQVKYDPSTNLPIPSRVGGHFKIAAEGYDLWQNIVLFTPEMENHSPINPNQCSRIAENLFRLHILSAFPGIELSDSRLYIPLEKIFSELFYAERFQSKLHQHQEYALIAGMACLTSFGAQFIDACVL